MSEIERLRGDAMNQHESSDIPANSRRIVRKGNVAVTRTTLHGARTWIRVGERKHVTRAGHTMTLDVWQSTCVKCVARQSSFQTTTCPDHRQRRR